jgi:hypothetical protein
MSSGVSPWCGRDHSAIVTPNLVVSTHYIDKFCSVKQSFYTTPELSQIVRHALNSEQHTQDIFPRILALGALETVNSIFSKQYM